MITLTNRDIAQAIRLAWSEDRFKRIGPMHASAEFDFQGFKVRCKNDRDSVEIVARKFEKGLPRGFTYIMPGQPGKARRFSIKTFKQFLQDQEPDNAVQYAQLFDWQNMSQEIQQMVRQAADPRSK